MRTLAPLLAAGDPLFEDGVDGLDVVVVLVKVLVAFAVLLVTVMFMVWFERKVISDMQNRIGPDRAGKWGILQTLADGIKLFFKEDLLPERADRRIFRLAPYLSLVPAFLAFAIVPVGGTVSILGRETRLQVADPPVGILFLLAMSSVAVYGVMLAGWSSGSKYPLLGSVRASAQMVSYEAALGLSIAAVVLVTGSLATSDIVESQARNAADWNFLRLGFLPFVIFLVSATAELNRPPFDLVEAEQELVGGFHTEYSSLRFALFFLAEFMNTVTMSAIIVTLFLGGPVLFDLWFIPKVSIIWFVLKLLAFLFMYVWFRATLPRVRYDQLMHLGWKYLIPASLMWLLVLAGMLIRAPTGDGGLAGGLMARRYGLLVFVGAIVLAGMLWRAMQVGRSASEGEHSPREQLREVR